MAMIALVCILIFSFIWGWRRSFPGATGLFAGALLAVLILAHAQRGESLHDAGFRLDTSAKAAALLVPLAAGVIALTVSVGHVTGAARLPPASTAALSLAQLVAFGLAQQYVLLGFFYRRLEGVLPSPALSVLATGGVFAIFHLPNPFLTVVTFFTGLIAAMVYRRAPNLWVNGIIHGLISYCLYYSLSPELTAGMRVGPGYWIR